MAVAMQTEDFPYLPSGLAEVNKMIKEHSDLFSDSQCKVCSAVLISESQKLTHYQSKKHANKVRRYFTLQNEKETAVKKVKTSSDSDCNNGETERFKKCLICDMIFSSPVVAESHYQGKVHAKNLRMNPAVTSQTQTPAQPKKKVAEDLSSVQVTGGNNNSNNHNPDKFCSICQASFNNPLMAQQHYVGKKHRKQMTKLKLMETYGPSTAPASTLKGYPCTVCGIELNSVEQYQSHISGAKHKNQVKKLGLNASGGNQEAAEPSFEGDVTAETQFSSSGAPAEEEQYEAGEAEEYAAGEAEEYAAGEAEEYAAGEAEEYAAGEAEEYAVGETEEYAAGAEPYAPEDSEYSEECLYT